MQGLALLIAAAVVSVRPAWAEEPRADLLYACDTDVSRVELVDPAHADPEWEKDLKSRNYRIERLASHDLIQYGAEDEQGNAPRKGSKSLKRQCGAITLTVRGGFLNERATGELGEIEFPLVLLLFQGKPIANELAFGECDTTFDRYQHRARCPQDWVVEVTAFPESPKRASLSLKHSYHEFRKTP